MDGTCMQFGTYYISTHMKIHCIMLYNQYSLPEISMIVSHPGV